MNPRQWNEYESGNFFGRQSFPDENQSGQKSLLILLHGKGSNEEALQEDGEAIAPESILLSLRAPIRLGRIAFAWFQDLSEAGTVLENLSEAIQEIASTENIPLHRVFVLGFSQGAILTLGLYLQGKLTLGGYLACSGRVLPEFASFARSRGRLPKDRAIFLAHGTNDEILPISFAHQTRDLIAELQGDLTYRESAYSHRIPEAVDLEARAWIDERMNDVKAKLGLKSDRNSD